MADTKNNEPKFLDDFEELLKEQELEDELELEQEQVKEKLAQVKDLDDLDDLLHESVTLASAKKLKSQGRRLDSAQEEALERQRILEEIASWEVKIAVVHLIETVCDCGATARRLSRFYEIHQHRKTSSQKLLQVVTTTLPVFHYETQEYTTRCICCSLATMTPPVTSREFPLLSSLGDSRNLHVESNTLLNELLEKVEVLVEETIPEPEIVTCPHCNGRGGDCQHCCNGAVVKDDGGLGIHG